MQCARPCLPAKAQAACRSGELGPTPAWPGSSSHAEAGPPSLGSRPRGSPRACGGGCPGPELLASWRVPGGGRWAWSSHPGPQCSPTDRGALPSAQGGCHRDSGALSFASIFNAVERVLAAAAKTPGTPCRVTNNTWEGSGGSASWQAGTLPPWNSARGAGSWALSVGGGGRAGATRGQSCPGLKCPGSRGGASRGTMFPSSGGAQATQQAVSGRQVASPARDTSAMPAWTLTERPACWGWAMGSSH